MAGDEQDESQKTEEPTPKRLEDALKKGDVAKSQEVKHFFVILAATFMVTMLAAPMMTSLYATLGTFIATPHLIPMGPGDMQMVSRGVGANILKALGLPLLLFVAAAIIGNVIQNKPVFTLEKVKPKFEKVSLLKGLKRMFSINTFMEFTKSIFKVVVVGSAVVVLVLPERDRLEQLVSYNVGAMLELVGALATRMLIGVVAIMFVLAGADFLFQKFQHIKKMRMTKQEVKDEHKQTEGDPMVKARLRQIRQERSRKRMMAAVPESDVVITNPTHFAVALKYDAETMAAPRLVAKGADLIARRIRDLAVENEVSMVENPPLARALFATVEIDEEIPPEHYKAVAEIIGFIMRARSQVVRSPRVT
ncbi:MAG: flagellar biosynthesis protein FlhB [Sphingomonadales bacterium]